MSKRKNSQNQIILLVIVLLVLLLIIAYILVSLTKGHTEPDENLSVNVVINEDVIAQKEEENELKRLQNLTERGRIEYYTKKFMDCIENKEFEEAYALLNKEFKKNYFPTVKEFREYCKETFPQMFDVDYTNFERNGNVYIVWFTLTDAINGVKGQGKEMNFVVRENDFNDFELSFSAI